MKRQYKRTIATVTLLALAAVLLLSGCAGITELKKEDKPASDSLPAAAAQAEVAQQAAQISYISIDINPSIRLIVKDGIVVDAKAYNDDGEEIIIASQVTGLSPEEAISLIINAIAEQGYFDSGDEALVITACGDQDEELLASIQDTANQTLEQLGIACDVVASCVTNPIVEAAKEAGMTPGRYKVIKYLAEQEGIAFEEAALKYSAYKMGQLMALIEDPGDVFGNKEEVNLEDLISGLTQEQQDILMQAIKDYEAALRAAQQQFVQTKKQVNSEMQTQKAQIQNAFKTTKDLDQFKQSRNELHMQFRSRRLEARQVFFAARAQAQLQFRQTVADLGLDEETIKALLAWDYDLEWKEDQSWDTGADDKDKTETEDQGKGRGSSNGKGKGQNNRGTDEE